MTTGCVSTLGANTGVKMASSEFSVEKTRPILRVIFSACSMAAQKVNALMNTDIAVRVIALEWTVDRWTLILVDKVTCLTLFR